MTEVTIEMIEAALVGMNESSDNDHFNIDPTCPRCAFLVKDGLEAALAVMPNPLADAVRVLRIAVLDGAPVPHALRSVPYTAMTAVADWLDDIQTSPNQTSEKAP